LPAIFRQLFESNVSWVLSALILSSSVQSVISAIFSFRYDALLSHCEESSELELLEADTLVLSDELLLLETDVDSDKEDELTLVLSELLELL